MKMLNNKVLLKKIEVENKTVSGIILTSQNEQRYCMYEVLEKDENIDCLNVGDKVLADRMKMTKHDDTFICAVEDVIGVFGD